MESLNSQAFGEHELHEMPLTSVMDSLVPHLLSLKVSPLHVVLDLMNFSSPHTLIGANIEKLHLALLFSSLDYKNS
jgi:hypothetical protein